MKCKTRTVRIEEYQCGTCGRVFYIDPRERTALDIEFGCPYGCDDNGKYLRDIKTEIQQVYNTPESDRKRKRVMNYVAANGV